MNKDEKKYYLSTAKSENKTLCKDEDHEWELKKGDGIFAHWDFNVCKKCGYEQSRPFTAKEFHRVVTKS